MYNKYLKGKLRKPRFLLGARASCPHFSRRCGRAARVPRGFRSLPKLFAILGLIAGMLFIYGGNTNIRSQTIDTFGQKLEIVQPGNEVMTIVGASTLQRAGGALAQMYRKPVTFEGPTGVLQWDGDVDQEVLLDGKIMRIPKRVTFVIPDEVKPDKNQQLDSSVLEKVVETYQKQFGGPKYKIISSELGLHLITDEVRDKNGQWVKEKPYLDAVISIPSEIRTGLGHIEKIVDAVNVPKDIKLSKLYIASVSDFNLFWKEEELSFEWGADKIVAREALINLLKKANTTLTWHMDCTDHPDINRKCTISVFPL